MDLEGILSGAPEPTPAPAEPATPASEPPVATPSKEATPTPEATPKVEKAVETPKVEGAPVDPTTKKEEPSTQALDWESDSNPYRKRHRDASAEFYRERNERLRLEQEFAGQLDVLNRKLDGTYDPNEETQLQHDPAEVLDLGQAVGKAQASLDAEYSISGKEAVDKELEEFTRLFEQNPIIQARVISSARPVSEARKVLREYRLVQKYKVNDPEKLEEAIRKLALDEARPKLEEEITKKVLDRIKKQETEVKGIGGARAAETVPGDKQFRPTPLTAIFGQ